MSDLDTVLEVLKGRGLSVVLRNDGTPCIRGNREDLTEENITAPVKEALRLFRGEIIERLKPKPLVATRRIVLLKDGKHSEAEEVLAEFGRDASHHGRTRELAAAHPGRMVACEWRQELNGETRWVRFLWVPCEEEYERRKAETTCTPLPNTSAT